MSMNFVFGTNHTKGPIKFRATLGTYIFVTFQQITLNAWQFHWCKLLNFYQKLTKRKERGIVCPELKDVPCWEEPPRIGY